MADETSARSRHFAAIEQKYGEPVDVWFARLAVLGDARYPDQMAFLQHTHAMSRTHANALVMTHRGSSHERRFANFDAYLDSLRPAQRASITALHQIITTRFPHLTTIIAYNQPMFQTPDGYVCVGLSAASKHVSLNPFSPAVVTRFAPQFPPTMVTTHTLKFPLDTPLDENLVVAIVTEADTS